MGKGSKKYDIYFDSDYREDYRDERYADHPMDDFRIEPKYNEQFADSRISKQKESSSMYSRTEEILRNALEEAKVKIREQNDFINEIMAGPTARGAVVSIQDGRALISSGAGLMELIVPSEVASDKNVTKHLKPGAQVRMLMDHPAIIDILDVLDITGDLALTSKEGKDGSCEVEFNGSTRVIKFLDSIKNPEPGDRLLVDGACHIAFKNIGPDESKYSFHGVTGVSWDDIGGLHEAKETMKEAIELPFKHPELYKKYGKQPVRGILLSGPPGCGKTMLAKAAATAISKIHNKKPTDTGFIYVKGPEMLDKYVGNTEAQIRGLFARARKHHKKNGYPAIVFIDEADALLGKRGGRNIGLETTVVPQFLSEMDGLDESGAMVLLATNRPDSLDSAVTRDGRIDRKVRVTRPDMAGAEEIFRLYMKDRPINSDMSANDMSAIAALELYDSALKVYDIIDESGHVHKFTLGDMVNGAMIAGMVDKATTIALRREIDNSKVSGLTPEDMKIAAYSIFMQNLHLNHEEELQEYVESRRIQVQSLNKTKL